MMKPSENIEKKARKLVDEMRDKTDITGEPFMNLLQGRAIDWIVEELDELHDKLTNEK